MITSRGLALLRAVHAAQRETEETCNKLRGLLFDKQLEFIDDPSRLKGAICTRRAGKSTAAGAYLLLEMLSRPKTTCLVICLTRDSAKRIYWRDVMYDLRDRVGLNIKFNYTELSMTLPNGSVCYFLGVDAKEDERRKLLGQKYSLVIIDESSEYRIDLEGLIYQTLLPSVSDYDGTICMVGTAGEFLGPLDNPFLWFAITREDGFAKRDWSVHRWTTYDNPHQRAQHEQLIAKIERENPEFKDTTKYLTHYLAKWPSVSDKLVYKYIDDRNGIDEAPKCTSFVIGCDLGSVDDTAFVAMGWREHDPNLYLLHASKQPDLDFQQVANQLKTLQVTYPGAKLIIDGANKQGVDHMRRLYSLSLENAEKHGKYDFIRMMNTDMQMGRIRVVRSGCADLINEWRSLEWDKRKPTEESAATPNHCSDAALYGWRASRHFLAEAEPQKEPTIDSEEAFDQQMERRARAQKRRGHAFFR